MSMIQEYALLIAVAIPVLAVVGLNAFLWLGGERGTLLLPSLAAFPSMEGGDAAVRVDGVTASSTGGGASRVAAANDEHAREAA